jgi:hypothetical protein
VKNLKIGVAILEKGCYNPLCKKYGSKERGESPSLF